MPFVKQVSKMQLKFIREKRNSKQIQEDPLRKSLVTLIGYYTRQFNFCRSTTPFFFLSSWSQLLPFLSPFAHPFYSPLHPTLYLSVEMWSRILIPFFPYSSFRFSKRSQNGGWRTHSNTWQNPSKIDPKLDFAGRTIQIRERMLRSMQIECLALWNSKEPNLTNYVNEKAKTHLWFQIPILLCNPIKHG